MFDILYINILEVIQNQNPTRYYRDYSVKLSIQNQLYFVNSLKKVVLRSSQFHLYKKNNIQHSMVSHICDIKYTLVIISTMYIVHILGVYVLIV